MRKKAVSLFVCFGGCTGQYSGITPSSMFRDHFWQDSGDHIYINGVPGKSNLAQACATGVPYLLYYLTRGVSFYHLCPFPW